MSPASKLSRTSATMRKRLIFALDVPTQKEALQLVDLLAGEVGLFKVGKQLFVSSGPQIVKEIRKRGAGVFLDLKFHDIPRTVAKAAAEATKLRVAMLDVHSAGSVEMMRQSVREVAKVARAERIKRPKLLAITVLTSLNREDLDKVGVRSSVENQVARLAKLARLCGMDGVVASPQEVVRIRRECGSRFLIVTPGVRPATSDIEDQKRVMTPEQAIRAGAKYLVVGSPIRNAHDPVQAARDIIAEMQRGTRLPRKD